jgi:outer membrane protein assembly factor BamB
MHRIRQLLFACVAVQAFSSSLRADDWPQWLGPKRDSVWRETGILEKFPEGGPKVLWRAPVAGGYAGPAVADGLVYVADFLTDVDTRKASAPQARPEVNGEERLFCLDAKTGEQRWKYSNSCKYSISYPAGPRCTPTVQQGKVYWLGAEGNLFCLDALKGTVLWSKDFKQDFKAKTPLWGFCGHPLVDGQKLFCVVGGEEGVVYAFDKDTGKELWHALSAREPGYAPPTMIEAAGVRQLVIWHAESLNSLNPETGEVYWSVPLEPSFGMAIAAPRQLGDLLFAGGIGGKSVLLRLAADKPGATEVWRGSTKIGASPVNSTPFLEEGFMYVVDQPGALMCVDLKTAEHVWETFRPVTDQENPKRVNSGTAFLVKNGDRFFLASETGHLIIARLSQKGYEEISRCKLLEPTGIAFAGDRNVVWSHPAFANKCVFWRNDKELICVSVGQ